MEPQATSTIVPLTSPSDPQGGVPQIAASDLILHLLNEKKAAREFQIRKHNDWNENYELYRNKVKTNRLTQRQAVNIPLMKETVKTLLSRVDDPPGVDWKEKSGDQQKELYYQEMWNDNFKKQKIEWKDTLEKKNVLLYGLSTKKLNLCSYGVDISVLDPFDIVFDPMMNPIDIETARFIIHQNIFRSAREILASKRYTDAGKEQLKTYLGSQPGIIQSAQNKEEWEKKLDRLKAMGVQSNDFPLFAGGDVVVNLTEHYTMLWDNAKQAFVRTVVTYADDKIELSKETLYDLVGVDFWPFVTWYEDIESSDIYPDAVADLVRTPNKVVNVWFSQLVENRTLRNFQMHWYDSTTEGYQPQTYEPGPGRMLPAPGDPNKTIMPVAIDGLDETMNAINFLIGIIERGTGATAITKGVPTEKAITLGEVQILLGEATERAVGMTKFYRGAWYETAKKWCALMDANPPDKVELSKLSQNGKLYTKSLYPNDWQSSAGYEPIVSSTSEQEDQKFKGIQKWLFALKQFPDNPVLLRIGQKRMLEILDLTPEEMRQVADAEKQRLDALANAPTIQPDPNMPGGGNPALPGAGAPTGAPVDTNGLAATMQAKLKELQGLTAPAPA